ncbi:MAG: nicotinate-nucleotide adenylyltransferase [Bacteroidota bacterium]
MKQIKTYKRIGVFGGSFDPPHIGHCVIAATAAEQLRLDKVIFVPAYIPPHKKHRSTSTARHRLAMTRLALRGDERFACSDLEVRRKGVSYTVDTLRSMKQRYSDAELFLIIGGDSLAMFPSWREPENIVRLARLAVYVRPDFPSKIKWKGFKHIDHVVGPLLEISSSTIRGMVARGKSARYFVPDSVDRYIRSHKLYRRKKR